LGFSQQQEIPMINTRKTKEDRPHKGQRGQEPRSRVIDTQKARETLYISTGREKDQERRTTTTGRAKRGTIIKKRDLPWARIEIQCKLPRKWGKQGHEKEVGGSIVEKDIGQNPHEVREQRNKNHVLSRCR